MRSICEEIGVRLRFMLDRTPQDPPARLVALLQRFDQLEQGEAPSIAPSLEELAAFEANKAPHPSGAR
jgi:hypothetical protein